MRKLFRIPPLKRALKYAVVAALIVLTVGVPVFLLAARSAQKDFVPVLAPLSPEQATPHYQRDEDATYLTLTEWYLVFNPQEYAAHLAAERPSRFPYFRAIGQLWYGYCQTYGIAQKHYRFNPGYNLMLVVIGGSSTVEFGIKGVYENTVGRFFEWTAGGEFTPEDRFAAQVAREYGEFIPHSPWFEYPFGQAFRALWTTHDIFGPNFLRKCERKFFLSLEYGIKTIYAALIRLASGSIYGQADNEVFASVQNGSAAALEMPGVRKVEELGQGAWTVAVPHYQGFTDTVPVLARAGVDFLEIAGNDEIMVTLVAPPEWEYSLTTGAPLFSMHTLHGDGKRIAVQVPVRVLGAFLREVAQEKIRLEHLFDY